MIHELKILPQYFELVTQDKKNFEVRKNDRNFQIGDMLELNEWNGEFTGRKILVDVTYMLNDSNYCKNNFVILSIKRIYKQSYME